VSGNAAGNLIVTQGQDGIGRAPDLERADLLQVLAFAEHGCAGALIDVPAGHDRRAMDVGDDSGVRGLDVLQGRNVAHEALRWMKGRVVEGTSNRRWNKDRWRLKPLLQSGDRRHPGCAPAQNHGL
jgi:hypothetical protein